MKSVAIFIVLLQVFLLCKSQNCIENYQELKATIRSNVTDNIHDMLIVFYPPNKSTNHIVFVHYCVVGEDDDDLLYGSNTTNSTENLFCNDTFIEYKFQWLVNSLPLLTDSDVLKANTFDFAALNQVNLTINIIDPFCDGVDGLTMLETLTVWLKSYATGDEDTIEAYCVFLTDDHENKSPDGFVTLFEKDGPFISFDKDKLLEFAKKFVIGLWLGTTSLTFALILHVGRCSIKVANAMNKVLWDVTQAADKFINIPQNFLKLVKSVTRPQPQQEKKEDPKQTESEPDKKDVSGQQKGIPTEQPEAGIELVSLSPPDEETQQQGIQLETDFSYLRKTKTVSDVKNAPYATKEREEELVDHAFAYFAKSLRKFSSSSIILLIAFLFYDIYVYVRFARKLSYDWFMLFPFPFWFLFVLAINIISLIITEIVLYCKNRKETKKQNKKPEHRCSVVFTFIINCITTISATTLPVFVFFHLFWLAIASSLFAIRIASSAIFYIPLLTFAFWFVSITSWILQIWKKLIKDEMNKQTKTAIPKRILQAIPRFIKPLIPYFFLPFWCLLLATLHLFSSFLLEVVDIKDQNVLVIIGVIIAVIGITKKIANDCKPKIDDDDDDDHVVSAGSNPDTADLKSK